MSPLAHGAGRSVLVVSDVDTERWLVQYPKGELLFTMGTEPDAGVTTEDVLAELP